MTATSAAPESPPQVSRLNDDLTPRSAAVLGAVTAAGFAALAAASGAVVSAACYLSADLHPTAAAMGSAAMTTTEWMMGVGGLTFTGLLCDKGYRYAPMKRYYQGGIVTAVLIGGGCAWGLHALDSSMGTAATPQPIRATADATLGDKRMKQAAAAAGITFG